MLGIVHTLVTEGLHDRAFLDRYTSRLARLRALSARRERRPAEGRRLGGRDLPASTPRPSGRWRAASHGRRALIVVSHSLQRAEHGEQPVWMGAVLAAVLGQIGLPGGGYGYALGAIALLRPAATTPCRWRRCRKAATASRDFIPVARIADMLLDPGTPYRYNGETRTYPDIRLVYWAGGNPFHHHQDLNRLRRAVRSRRYVRRARAWLDSDGAARRYRPALHHDAGARGYRRQFRNDPLLVPMHRDRRALSARRATTTRSSPVWRSGSARARPSPRGAASASGWSISTSRRALASKRRACRRRASTEFWAGGGLELPQAAG